MALITEARLRAGLSRGLPNPYVVAAHDKLTPAAADFLKSRGITLVRKPKTFGEAADSTARNTPEPVRGGTYWPPIPVGVSNRHVHLSEEHIEQLFGKGYRLTPLRELSQQGQFAAQETLTLAGPRGALTQVRILGPSRTSSQVEISRTDGYALGIHPPLRLSGQLDGTPGITLIGPKQAVGLTAGLIVARNHVHMSLHEAEQLQVAHGEMIVVEATGERSVVYPEVTVRVSPNSTLELHLDTDEANAAGLKTGDHVRMLTKTHAWRSGL